MAINPIADPHLNLVFGALSDPTRRALLTRMQQGEATVTDLAAPYSMSLPAISKHLRVLEQAGLLKRRIDGRAHYLRLDPGPLHAAVNWIERHRQFWEGSLDRLASLVETPAKKTRQPKQKPKKQKKP